MRPSSSLRLALALAAAGAALATPPAQAAEPGGPALTIYQGNLALVREARQLKLPAGTSRVRLEGLPATLEPESVTARPLDGRALELRAQRFLPETLNPQQLMQAAVGQKVQVRLPAEGGQPSRLVDATLLSLSGPVVRIGDQVYLSPPGEIVLPADLAAGRAATPTLEWQIKSPAAGPRAVELAYLAGGFDWEAQYVAVVPEQDGPGEIQSWADVHNDTGRNFEEASLRLVAGEVNRAGEPSRPRPQPMAAMRAEKDMAEGAGFTRSELGFYHAYDLAGRVFLPAGARSRFPFLAPFRPAMTQLLSFDGARQGSREGGTPVAVAVRFKTPERPDVPMPAGTARIYRQEKDGALSFLGQDTLPATPAGRDVTLTLGGAFDVLGERVLQSDQRPAEKLRRQSWKITLTNRRERAERVTVREHAWGDWRLVESAPGAKRTSANDFEFAVTVPPRGTAAVSYTLEIKQP